MKSSDLSPVRRPHTGSLTTRLTGGSNFEFLLLQSGHSFTSLSFHQLFTQSLQKLWLHDRMTGSLKTSWQTGQKRSSSNLEAIESPGEAENRQSVSHSSTSFPEVHFLSESRCLLNSRSVCGASAGCSLTLLSCSWTHSGRLVQFGLVWFGR